MRERGDGGGERVRGKEGDFFSSCKPFQLCSGLRTETGRERESEAREPTRLKEGERKRKKEEEELGLRGTLFYSQSGVESERQKTATKERKGRERVVGLSAARERVVKRERGRLQSRAWTGAGRAVWVFALWIQSHDSLLCPACLPAWLVQASTPSPPLFLHPDALFLSCLNPSRTLPALDLLYHLSLGAIGDLSMRGAESEIKED